MPQYGSDLAPGRAAPGTPDRAGRGRYAAGGRGGGRIFVAGVFAYTGWQMGKDGRPIGLAVMFMLGLTGFFVRERIRAHRRSWALMPR